MHVLPIKTPLLHKNFQLEETIFESLKKNKVVLKSGDILVISSKIVSLSQGLLIALSTIQPSARAKRLTKQHYTKDARVVELILREADAVFPGPLITTLKENILIPAAGIDLSNAPKDHAILWPMHPQKVATELWRNLRKKSGAKNLGIIICDSRCQPLRWGTTGVAIAWAGFFGVEDARGEKDIYGKPLHNTRKAVADDLASASVLVMGEAGEKIPLVVVRDAPVKFTNRTQKKSEIFVEPMECVFAGIYGKKLLQ